MNRSVDPVAVAVARSGNPDRFHDHEPHSAAGTVVALTSPVNAFMPHEHARSDLMIRFRVLT